jgi:hypothetical protein
MRIRLIKDFLLKPKKKKVFLITFQLSFAYWVKDMQGKEQFPNSSQNSSRTR